MVTPTHLVVLAHGLAGISEDLGYLERQLKAFSDDVKVLASRVNEDKSKDGVENGGNRLADDVRRVIGEKDGLTQISFVGNSLGGLYVRHCCQALFDEDSGLIAGLEPRHFVTVASPWLGVRFHTHIDVPEWIKRPLVVWPNGQTGQDLFLDDDNVESITDTLVYRMATHERYLAPLRAFQTRRAYANFKNDFLVPLGTSAFMGYEETKALETSIGGCLPDRPAILDTMVVHLGEPVKRPSGWPHIMDFASDSINALGWEKVLVYFPDVLPLAHNKICALEASDFLRRFYAVTLSGSAEGAFVMDHLALHLTGGQGNEALDSDVTVAVPADKEEARGCAIQ